ncbi:hypothetical protein [Haliscomenobacter sp.]|uniref:hypothetical protein n=1 Tax=Haliscomenobacter sp. TaxID=2717303 RepID=UPI003BA99DF1
MSQPLANYTFLPWLRQGIAGKITAAHGDTNVKLRAEVNVALEITSNAGGKKNVSRAVQIYGPGDLTGVESKAIVRTEPRDWVTNFEPNYMAFIEFYDEDFPWRYTPAAPNGHRLFPWLQLVVLKEGVLEEGILQDAEFEEGKNLQDRPLAFITVSNPETKFPDPAELWAWAHVHVNGSLDMPIISSNGNTLSGNLENMLNSNPDLAGSRILCPRQLEPSTRYHAFLMPAFESGRLAGLGLNPDDAPFATQPASEAYQNKPEALNFPYYYRWQFHTSTIGDFEYLVRLLEPKPVDSRVGRRDMDVSKPLPGSDLIPALNDPNVQNILRLGGALRVPVKTMECEDQKEYRKYENWATRAGTIPHPWQQKLASFINLADDYRQVDVATANADPNLNIPPDEIGDPLITAPLYAQWHALTERLLVKSDGTPVSNADNWVHELNLDPRFRVAAGFGTKVVQTNQEKYMDAAWNQIGRVLEVNRRIRWGQLSAFASGSWHERYFTPLALKRPELFMMRAAPIQKRVINQGLTIYNAVKESPIPQTLLSAPMRRAIRPGNRLSKKLPFDEKTSLANLLTRINAGEVLVAPPKAVPPGLPTINKVDDDIKHSLVVNPELGGPTLPHLLVNPLLKNIVLILATLILVVLLVLYFVFNLSWTLTGIGAATVIGLLSLYWRLSGYSTDEPSTLREEDQTPEMVSKLPKIPDFRITKPGEEYRPRPGDKDSTEAIRFKNAIAGLNELLLISKEAAPEPLPKKAIAVKEVAQVFNAEIVPQKTVSARVLATVAIPKRLLDFVFEIFDDVMEYPIIDQPMYEPLKNISSELFLPNIHLIGPNTISLLETNQKFIEAYMVGLNHEFARELLWREYPTDQRGSYFRQFWDTKGYYEPNEKPTEQKKEELRDIPELHIWPGASKLGTHDNREVLSGTSEEEVVLVIRGELLKKYPNTVIYAQKADWVKKEDGSNQNDLTEPRVLRPIPTGQEDKPPRSIVRTPLYEAQVQPDIYFFGFDLTAEVALGESGENPDDDAGWFFVLKERPGDPRFGLDSPISNAGIPSVIDGWNDLSWKDELLNSRKHLKAAQNVNLNFVEPDQMDNGVLNPVWEQYNDDKNVTWATNVSAAELAYILYQVPVMVAVHAAEMLPKQSDVPCEDD